ncbi:uncharacterized protein CTRU02_203019 [Colletotrichum truncatum]|uniref:Uncharacterized protein n=1 Tax=Colletotrichum truncatum TaxID=5467 RepID=A0ACC3Z823_COLTU|nr:uncharacterized protein CTRU02_13160 [Colletotrichum truncatum]KAF6783652.1 hypothetical protein CTRU02_13160 [Colletotrichum truncatum]
MSGHNNQYRRSASNYPQYSYPQSSYSTSANTGGQNSSTGQTGYTSYATTVYVSTPNASERFYHDGQPSRSSAQSMSSQLADWDRQWNYASSRRN